jgi:FkbM family methyltransferase
MEHEMREALMAMESRLLSAFEQRLSFYMSRRFPIVDPGTNRIFMHTKENQRVYLDPREPHISHHMLASQEWEPQVKLAMKILLKPGSTFVDVGANIGLHTLYAHTLVGNSGRIISVEANPDTIEMLRKNIVINALWNKIDVFPVAASDIDGDTTTFECFSEHPGLSGFTVSPAAKTLFYEVNTKQVTVPTRTVDSILSEKQLVPDLIKIDVEGFERRVLEGAKNTLALPEVSFIIESPSTELAKFFRERGFNCYRTNEGIAYVAWEHFDKPIGGDYVFCKSGSQKESWIKEYDGKGFPETLDDSLGAQVLHGVRTFYQAVEIQNQQNATIAELQAKLADAEERLKSRRF